MNRLDRLYSRLLQVGFLVLRQAIDEGDVDWARAEVEFLHNVPSLIGESASERHAYFWNEERAAYRKWIEANGSPLAQSRMRTYYEPIWEEYERSQTSDLLAVS